MADTASYRWAFLCAGAVAIGIGVLGLLDLRKAPYAGYAVAREFNIIRVVPGSPAEAAGLQVGDKVKVVGGIQATDTKALWRRPRAEIGDTRTYCVERDGEIQEIDITFGGVPRRQYWKAGLSLLVGLCFLCFTFWAYHRAASISTVFLALFGFCFGLEFFPAPYARNFQLRTFGEALATLVIIAGFAFLIHYLQLFPKRRALLDRGWGVWLIYLPAALMALFILGLILVQPEFNTAVRQTVGWISFVFVVGYFGGALVSVLLSYQHATPDERRASGVGLVVIGALVGLVPLIVSASVRTFAPSLVLPGEFFYPLALGLIPITLSIAAVRHHRRLAA